MFCKNCGKQLADGVNFCNACGASIVGVPSAVENSSIVTSKIKKKKSPLVAFLGVVAIIVVIILLLGGRNLNSTVKQYVDATIDGNGKKIVSLMPDFFVKQAVNSGEYRNKQEMIEDFDFTAEASRMAFEAAYGKNLKHDVTIVDVYEYSPEELDMYLYYNFYDHASKIDAVAEVTYNFSISGKTDSDSWTETLLLFKMGSKWYVANAYY